METMIANMLAGFEKGTLSRRQLIQGLTGLATAGAATSPARAQSAPFTSTRIDHISVQVTDLAPSIDFYQKVFGLTIINEDKPNEIVRMGTGRILVSPEIAQERGARLVHLGDIALHPDCLVDAGEGIVQPRKFFQHNRPSEIGFSHFRLECDRAVIGGQRLIVAPRVEQYPRGLITALL